ncbi:TolC family protein [Gynurincola endophyticus]|uniref:TolC family protein n=1 Tax=Gynurincola endophyticus TaxID=2479004 RepID=UPI000F8EA94D|nr:TolC family protein [Gynurincola endophyticus]
MNHRLYIKVLCLSVTFLLPGIITNAQTKDPVGLDELLSSLKDNSRPIRIKEMQILEKESKVKEAGIKKYPVVSLSSAYQYNVNVGELGIPAGTLGQLPLSPTNVVSLPAQNLNFPLGEHHTFNAGAAVYQPLTQLGKIQAGIDVAKVDHEMSKLEKSQIELQLQSAVEQLYYGILVVRKRQLEAAKNIEVAKLQLYDVEGAVISGKTISVSEAGLKANIADEEQKLLKLNFEEQDYIAELRQLTGIDLESVELKEPAAAVKQLNIADLHQSGNINNVDVQLSRLQEQKATIGIRAAQKSSLPEIGVLAGYTYQLGNAIFPQSNPFIGASLKWNIQDLFSNKETISQRKLLHQQAAENVKYVEEQTNTAIDKAYRKWQQSQALIQVATKAVGYRKEALRIENDKKAAGLNTPIQLLTAESSLAKAEADLYAAMLNEQIVLIELRKLTTTPR